MIRLKTATSTSKFLLFFLALLCLPSLAIAANTYWVSGTLGNDNNACTSSASPPANSGYRATPIGGMGCLQGPGDIVYIRAGTYGGGIDTFAAALTLPSGTSWSNPVTISGYQSEVVTINNPGLLQLGFGNPVYVSFENMIIDGQNATSGVGISFYEVSRHRIKNVEVKNVGGTHSCLQMTTGSTFNQVIGGKVHDCSLNSASNQGHGLYVEGADNLVDGTEIYNIYGGYAIHSIHFGGTPGSTVYSARNTYKNLYIHDGINATGGIVLGVGDANVAYNNIVVNFGGGMGTYGGATNSVFYSNTVYNEPGGGIDFSNSSGSIARNNIFYQTTDVAVKNGTPAGTGIIQDHNLCGDATCTGTGSINNSNPQFVSTDCVANPTTCFRIPTGSPAKDAGNNLCSPGSAPTVGVPCSTTSSNYSADKDGLSRPSGANWDIGAYEYNAGAAPFTVTISSTNPTSGAVIIFNPTDNNGLGQCTTPCSGTWNSGTTINLTASSTAGGNNFSSWSSCDTTSGTNCTINNIAGNRTATANYLSGPPPNRTLTVTSTPSGVVVALSTGLVAVTPFSIVVPDSTALTATANATVSGPSARYNLTEGTGTTVSDQSGNGNTLTLTNTTWSGSPGTADLIFNGTTSSASAPSSPLFSVVGQFTLAATVIPSQTLTQGGLFRSIATNNRSIFLHGNSSTFYCPNNGVWGGFQNPSGTNGIIINCSSSVLNSGVTYRIVLNKTLTDLKLYVNESLVSTTVSSLTPTYSTGDAGTFMIGSSRYNEFFPGRIRNVQFFAKGFTQTDVNNYGSGTLSDGNPFIAWANCTSGSGTTCNVTMTQDKTINVNYVPVPSITPALSVGAP